MSHDTHALHFLRCPYAHHVLCQRPWHVVSVSSFFSSLLARVFQRWPGAGRPTGRHHLSQFTHSQIPQNLSFLPRVPGSYTNGPPKPRGKWWRWWGKKTAGSSDTTMWETRTGVLHWKCGLRLIWGEFSALFVQSIYTYKSNLSLESSIFCNLITGLVNWMTSCLIFYISLLQLMMTWWSHPAVTNFSFKFEWTKYLAVGWKK